MDDLPVMDVLHPKTNLGEPIEDLTLRERSSSLLFDSVLQVTTISIVHDDAKFASFSLVDLNECYYVWMLQSFQKLGLLDRLSLLFLRHPVNVNHLHDTLVAVLHAAH